MLVAGPPAPPDANVLPSYPSAGVYPPSLPVPLFPAPDPPDEPDIPGLPPPVDAYE